MGQLTTQDNYHVRDFNVTFTQATSLTLKSTSDFSLQIVGALGSAGCVERLYVDLGSVQSIHAIRTRHWPGSHGLTSELVTSVDNVTWNVVTVLDPNALHAVVTVLDTPLQARYVGVQHTEDESSYAKV